jgi:4-hydroxybenzoate polyprenyltransferase
MSKDSKTEAGVMSHTVAPLPERIRRPLYVDMDGTVLATDVLWEMLIRLMRTRPWLLIRAPFWLIKGKAFFKRQLVSHITLNPALLPYHEPVIDYLNRERRKGREVILATASDREVATSVANHLDLFSGVLASDGIVNLAGHAKLSAILVHADGADFDYMGNSWPDLPIWQQASRAILVKPSRRLLAKTGRTSSVEAVLGARLPFLRVFFRTLRVHQWSKNVLLLVPLLLAHKITDSSRLVSAVLGFVAFSLAASGVYILNDLLDLESDRQHPTKRARPLAAGLLPIPIALATSFVAIASSVGIAGVLLPTLFAGVLLIYLATTMAYSFALKRIAILDVIVLAGLYTIRVIAGAVATDVPASPWFLAFSTFLFLSLAFVKRYGELRLAGNRGGDAGFLEARGYQPGDLDLLRSVGASSGYVAVAVFALYINSGDVHLLYARPAALWLIGPLILYWITRVWLLAHRGRMHSDPVVFAFTDRTSYLIAVLVAILLLVASLK